MDKRNLRRLDYVAGVTGHDDIITRDFKRLEIPSMYSSIKNHELKVDVGVLESLSSSQLDEFKASLSAHPDIVGETIVSKDCIVKAELRRNHNQLNNDQENTLFGYVSSAAELALRSTVQLEQ